jgi:hypothetical protein
MIPLQRVVISGRDVWAPSLIGEEAFRDLLLSGKSAVSRMERYILSTTIILDRVGR